MSSRGSLTRAGPRTDTRPPVGAAESTDVSRETWTKSRPEGWVPEDIISDTPIGADDARAVRVLREAMPDVGAARGWIVDQAAGVELVGEGIARAGFASVVQSVP